MKLSSLACAFLRLGQAKSAQAEPTALPAAVSALVIAVAAFRLWQRMAISGDWSFGRF